MNEQDRHIAVWNNCLQIIVSNIDRQQFDTWFKPIRPVSLVESTLTVEVPSDFFREYLEGAYLHLLKSALKRAIGADAKLVYMVRPVRSEQAMVYPAAATTNPVNPTVSISTYHPSGNPGPFVFPGIQRVQINPRLKAEYCFENLVEGECNKMGITAGESISKAPGKTPFNPLFLFGGPGLGKTHLSQAIGIAVKQRYPELVVLYVTGNEFKTQYMDAAMGGKLTDFMAYYMRMDVLIVDDIQGLLGQGSQNAFFNVFNHLHQSGKQLIFTSDRAQFPRGRPYQRRGADLPRHADQIEFPGAGGGPHLPGRLRHAGPPRDLDRTGGKGHGPDRLRRTRRHFHRPDPLHGL